MNLALAIQIIQFLRALAPMIPELYGAVKAALPNSPGLVKFDAFIEQVKAFVPMVDELKPFVPVLEQSIPALQRLVTAYHGYVTGPTPAPSAS